MELEKIKALLCSSDKKNQALAWELDKSLNGGNLKKTLEEKYGELVRILKTDL